MKKLLLVLLAACFILSVCSCSTDDTDTFHYDLIAKYQNDGSSIYYKDIVDDIEIVDFGAKYNVPIYDIEPTREDILTYLYKFEGDKEYELGMAEMNDYVKYLEEKFEHLDKDGFFFKISDTNEMWVTFMDLKPMTSGLLVAVVVPIKTAASDSAGN